MEDNNRNCNTMIDIDNFFDKNTNQQVPSTEEDSLTHSIKSYLGSRSTHYLFKTVSPLINQDECYAKSSEDSLNVEKSSLLKNLNKFNFSIGSDFLNSYYSELKEFHGSITSINDINKQFFAELVDIDDNNKFKGAFSFNDIAYQKDMIKKNSQFVLLIGKENTGGTVRRFSHIKFRRIPVWTNNEIQEIESKAQKMAKDIQDLVAGYDY